MYWFKSKFQQIRNVLRWLPTLWKTFDWDYRYSLDVFQFQLQNQVKFLKSDKATSMEAKNTASRMEMILRLLDKVYNEEYVCEYMTKLHEKYGYELFEPIFIDTGKGDGTSYLKYKYETIKNEELQKKIEEDKDKFFEESKQKQKRAHKLLWDLVEHNIQNWWD